MRTKTKKLRTMLICVMTFISAVALQIVSSVSANANAVPFHSEGGLFYMLNANSTYTVCLEDYSITHAQILDEIGGIPVTEIMDYGFAYAMELVEIVIPESITQIGFGAFMGCDNLRSVNATNVVDIYDFAFAFSGVRTVIMPDDPGYIGTALFMSSAPKLYLTQSEAQAISLFGGNNWLMSYGGVAADIYYAHTENIFTLRTEGDGYILDKAAVFHDSNKDFLINYGPSGLPVVEIASSLFWNFTAKSIIIDTGATINFKISMSVVPIAIFMINI